MSQINTTNQPVPSLKQNTLLTTSSQSQPTTPKPNYSADTHQIPPPKKGQSSQVKSNIISISTPHKQQTPTSLIETIPRPIQNSPTQQINLTSVQSVKLQSHHTLYVPHDPPPDDPLPTDIASTEGNNDVELENKYDVDSEFEADGEESETTENNPIINDTEDDNESVVDQSESSNENTDAKSTNSDDVDDVLLEACSTQLHLSDKIAQAFGEISDKHHLSPGGFESKMGGLSYKGSRGNKRGKGIPAMRYSQDKEDQSLSL